MTNIQRLSEAVYIGLCYQIGTREQVSMRRDIVDIEDMVYNKSDWYNGIIVMLSGSYREGFRLSGSDQDRMYWHRDHKVVCDLSQAQQYQQPGTTLFLMECVECRPGFVLLQLLTPSSHIDVTSSCVRVNDVCYISSSLFRKYWITIHGKYYKEHGPCANLVLSRMEFDEAHCLSCDFWPPLAASWIQKCISWPPPLVLYEIIVNGCHLMPIGSKGSLNESIEWRLSFSQAEQKLVYAMNHCQFLVYGLLKLFLKEVINQIDNEKLICSYFMKTAVFWEISENNISCWCPQNILSFFWACFKRIIKWVYTGYCTNFFVTENNMFLGKIWGFSQRNLFVQLYKLYEKGMVCLLYCKSIRNYLLDTMWKATIVTSLRERRRYEVNYACKLILEIENSRLCRTNLKRKSLRCLQAIEYLSKTSVNKIQRLYLHVNVRILVSFIAFSMHKINIDGNRTMYIADMLACTLLKKLYRSGFGHDILYLAMHYYRTCRYTEAISLLQMTEAAFTQQKFIDKGSLERLIVEIRVNRLLDVWIRFICKGIELNNSLLYINQLSLEQKISKQNGQNVLTIPPLLLLRMLYVLCYNHVNTKRRQEALCNMYTLVHHDADTFILNGCNTYSDISYQILGICQEICGDLQAAIDSYNLSLRCSSNNKIRDASLIRLQHAISKFRNLC